MRNVPLIMRGMRTLHWMAPEKISEKLLTNCVLTLKGDEEQWEEFAAMQKN